MAITASTISTTDTLETFRVEFNNLRADVQGIEQIGANTITIADGGTIGSASDADAMTISAAGVVTFSQAPSFTTGLSIGDLDIDGGTDIGAAIVDADLFIVDDGAGGTNRKTAASRIKTYIADVTLTTAAQTNITSVGALDGGSITSNFGSINTGASTITTTGAITGGSFVVADAGNIGSASDTDAIAISSAGVVSFSQDVSLVDGKKVILGSNSDISFQYDESTTDSLVISSDVNDAALGIVLQADAGADAGDEWKLNIANGGTLTLGNDIASAGTYVTLLTITPNSTAASSTHAFIGALSASAAITATGGLIVPDDGDVGSASATDAIQISSAGIVTFKDDILIKDGGTIGAASATDAITIASTGIVTFVDDIIIKDAGTIGSASDTDAISISSGGVVNISATTANTGTGDGALTVAGGVGIALDASIGDDLRLISDGAILSFGVNSDVTATHVHNVGIDFASTRSGADSIFRFSNSANATASDVRVIIQTGGTSGGDPLINFDGVASNATWSVGVDTSDTKFVIADADKGGFDGSDEVLTIATGGNISVPTDSAVLKFGANEEITLTHVHDVGLTLTNTVNGTDDRPVILQLKSEEDAIVAADVIASLEFAAGDSDGTDGATVAAGIHAIAEDTFSASANPTKLVFTTGVSETAAASATAKMTLSSVGHLGIGADAGNSTLMVAEGDAGTWTAPANFDTLVVESNSNGGIVVGVPDADEGVIGISSPSHNGAIGYGMLYDYDVGIGRLFTSKVGAKTRIEADNQVTQVTFDGASGSQFAEFANDVGLKSDSSILYFGADNEIRLSHVADVGLTLTNTIADTDNRPTILQLKSEEDAIVQDDVIASIEMAAGDSDGTDGATIAAGIHAIAEGTFSASANATKLVFTTGVSETAAASATAKMTLSSAGLLTIADDFMMKDGGTIGVASVNDAITIASTGIVTFKDDIIIKDGGTIGSGTTPGAMTVASGGAVTFSAVPSFPNDTVETADIQDNAVTLAKMAGITRGSIIIGNASGDPAALAVGTSGYVLTSDGTDVSYAAVSVGDNAINLAKLEGEFVVMEDGGTDGSGSNAGDNIIDETDSDDILMEGITRWVTSGLTIRDSYGNHLKSVNGVS